MSHKIATPKVNLPSSVKVAFMGKGNREFRQMWARAIAFNNDGIRKVAAQDAAKQSRKAANAEAKVEAALAGTEV